MSHETFHLGLDASVEDGERWMRRHGVDWGPAALNDPLSRFGIYASDAPEKYPAQGRLKYLGRPVLFVAEVGDTLCWDGTRVQLHSSTRKGVKTCRRWRPRMLKFGTGDITGVSKTGMERLRIEGSSNELSGAERAEIIAEGEEETEGE